MSDYISDLIKRAKKAQAQIEHFTQEQVDGMCERIAFHTSTEDYAHKIAQFAVEETGMGKVESKFAKMVNKIKGGWYDMKGKKSVDVIEEDRAKGLIKIAKPIGVVGAIIPVTNCEATPVLKSMNAIKTRNAIILAPHPRSAQTNTLIANQIRELLEKNGFPADLVISMDEVSMENTQALMKQCDLILATGGGGLVKAAYSSGTPAYGVGAGNAYTIVDETADLDDTAAKIYQSKTFDYATSCSSENGCIVYKGIYDDFIKAMEAHKGYLLSAEEKQKLQAAMWHEGHLNRDIVAQPASTIAKIAGIDLPEGKEFLMVEESGIGADYPFCGEKLSVVTTLYQWENFDDAVKLVNDITDYSGSGHSCGIHSTNEERILQLGRSVKVSRVMVNQPQCLANSGSWTNHMPITLTLGCGTWGGNAASENINWKHLLNTTWISSPTPSHQPADEDLFSAEVRAGN
ncbi:aldehyde dehydrogenase family protein [Vibrio viridaestus]|uniref:Aldehyde dehydrogenase family protein n=1 Tax=Vibrio viridaestus TaxID=2487322 RepID=A0A3N9TET8_9VIBR|nr:aldehyde dehydrogenase family protein [Vibrio viridaestus]RQW62233.1 aldehyde dehydrogenase family protein [Vibrio viridaestus]